ncbi:hypothetical protein LPUS_03257 [Lasallia pustulata]|uniref:HTH CENPB-type domain-containing protein n=1 Tax=Lasallia pustulata TaxID=136370 RepID=A0A1W5CUF8_9LECA|nr:hypothetical protein LPUS_03257 [Lasallia pustulata]
MVRNYILKALRRVDFDDSDSHFTPLEKDKDTQIQQAYNYWLSTKDQEDPPSLHKVAKGHNIAYSTLRHRKNGVILKKEANQAMQKLTPIEEDVIALWVTTLTTWGSLPTHLQLVKMVPSPPPRAQVKHYFELYKSTKEQYDIDDENE